MNESNEFTLKTEIRITKIDEKEKLFYQNKYINFVLFEQPNEIISNGLEIPSSVASIGSCFFRECSSLSKISIPSSATSIGDFAFTNCTSLIHISIPSSITTIGGSIFSACWRLKKIQIIPNKNERIKLINDTFLIFKSSKSENFDTLIWTKNDIKTANISPIITKRGSSAFYGCTSLTRISIPSSITSIGDDIIHSMLEFRKYTNYSK